MVEILRAALPFVMLIGGMALIVYAACRHYVALPEEQGPRDVAVRAAIGVTGIVLVLLGAGFLS